MSINPRILYVDDNSDSCDIISTMLPLYSDWRYSVTSVESADSAISLMKKQNFDIFILDYALPDVSGVELCEHIRKTDAKTPVVFFTGMTQDDDRRKAIEAGASEYFVKPNDLMKLVETVKQLVTENR